MRRRKFCCILCVSLAVMIGPNLWAADAAESSSTGKTTPSERISTFDLKFQQQIKRSAWVDGPLSQRFTPSQGLRRSVGSALSTEAGIGKGESVDLTYDDAQYTEGQGRHIAHWWNGEYGIGAEVSVHFGYRDMADTTGGGAFGLSGYSAYDAVAGTRPPPLDGGCGLQSADTIGWGGMPSLDIMPNGRVVMGAMSHLGNGFLGDGSAFVDNMFFYQDSEFSCTYGPGLNTTFIDSTVYRPSFMDQSDGNYSRAPQVVTQWDGANTIVHVLLMEELGTPLFGNDYADSLDYYTCTYYRKTGETAGTWSAGQVIDSLWFPWPSMAAAPFPHEGVAISYTNPSYYGALLNNPYDLDVWYRESADRGLTWSPVWPVTDYINAIADHPAHFVAWIESQALYSDDGDLHIIWTAKPTSYDPYFDGFDWQGYDQNLYHWSQASDDIVKVANGNFNDFKDYICGGFNTLHCGFGGSNAGYIANINLAECDDKLYCVWNQIHERANYNDWLCYQPQPMPGVLDDCSYTGSRQAMANWEIYMSVSTLDNSSLWDRARNVSDTYTPECGLAGDPDAVGLCASDYKPSVEKYGLDETGLDLYWPSETVVDLNPVAEGPYEGVSYLNMQYLDDQFPGPAFWGLTNPPATLNSIRWMRLACVEPVNAPEIRVLPREVEWPLWVELGQTSLLTVTVVNEGNMILNVTEIGYDDGGEGWLSVLWGGQTPLQVTPGVISPATFDIVIDASSLSSTQWLDGEVWLKSDAINNDSVSIPIHILAAADVEPVRWDTVQSHVNMFDVYFYPEGECVALAVSNFGEIGQSGGLKGWNIYSGYRGGGVNLDYRESDLECGQRDADAIYLYSGSAFTILADDVSGTNARLTCSYNDQSQAQETGWDPVVDLGSITDGLAASGDYDSVYTGRFVNRDTTIAMERVFYTPRSDDPNNEIINFVICATKIYSGDGQAHDHVTVGNVIDWNVPSEDINMNTSGLSSDGFVYVRGSDTTGVLSCQSNTNRYATEAFGGAYTSAEWQSDDCANSEHNYHSVNALAQTLVQDTTHYRDGTPLVPSQPNPEVWWQETSVAGLNADATVQDQAVWLSYEHDYNLGAQDTLYYWTVLTTVRDGTLADLEAQVKYGQEWYTETIRGCPTTCCELRVGNCNGVGGDEPTIGDVAVMIDHCFICIAPCGKLYPCIAECDINQSGGHDPTRDDITIGDISVLIDYLFITGPSLGLNDCL